MEHKKQSETKVESHVYAFIAVRTKDDDKERGDNKKKESQEEERINLSFFESILYWIKRAAYLFLFRRYLSLQFFSLSSVSLDMSKPDLIYVCPLNQSICSKTCTFTATNSKSYFEISIPPIDSIVNLSFTAFRNRLEHNFVVMLISSLKTSVYGMCALMLSPWIKESMCFFVKVLITMFTPCVSIKGRYKFIG